MKAFLNLQIGALVTTALFLTGCNDPERDFHKAEAANTEEAFNQFIKKHPDSPLVAKANTLIERNAYDAARKTGTVASYEVFLKRFQNDEHVLEANGRRLVSHEVFLKRFQNDELTSIAAHELEALEMSAALVSPTVSGLEAFLAKYPASTNTVQVRQTLCRLAFAAVVSTNTVQAYEDFTNRFPGTEQATEAAHKIEILDYNAASNANNKVAYANFLNKHPDSGSKSDIAKRIEILDFKTATNANTAFGYETFLKEHPDSRSQSEIAHKLSLLSEDSDWNEALRQNSPELFREFLKKHPNSSNVRIVDVTLGTRFTFFQWDSWSPHDREDAGHDSDASNGAWGLAVDSSEISIYPITPARASKLGLTSPPAEGGGGFVVIAPSSPRKAKVLCVKYGAKYRIVADADQTKANQANARESRALIDKMIDGWFNNKQNQ